MRPLLDNSPLVEHGDRVGSLDGGEAMRDDKGRASLGDRIEGRMQARLRFRIEGRSGLVENENRRVLEQRAGDGNALPLAAGQQHPVLADASLHAVGQPVDEGKGLGPLSGIADGCRGCFSQ